MIFDGLDMDQIEVEDEGFFPEYEVEVYHDEYAWNAARTDRTNDVVWEGRTVSPTQFLNEDGSVDAESFAAEIRGEIEKSLNNEDRIGPVYVVC